MPENSCRFSRVFRIVCYHAQPRFAIKLSLACILGRIRWNSMDAFSYHRQRIALPGDWGFGVSCQALKLAPSPATESLKLGNFDIFTSNCIFMKILETSRRVFVVLISNLTSFFQNHRQFQILSNPRFDFGQRRSRSNSHKNAQH